MPNYNSKIPTTRYIPNSEYLDSYEVYYEELKDKSLNLACCFGRMIHNNPNHFEIKLWREKSKFWHEYHSGLRYMKAPIENAFDVFEAIGSFAAEYELYTKLEMELINKSKANEKSK